MERALVIINIALENQGLPALHLGPRAHSEQSFLREKTQEGQKKNEELRSEREDSMSEEDQENNSSREAQNPEGTQAQEELTIKEL